MRQLKIEEAEENGGSGFAGRTTPYKAALEGNWTKMKAYYGKHPERVLEPLTVERDTAFHIAAYSGRTDLLRHLLRLVTTTKTLEALSKHNRHGNTVFHEVATTDKVDAADLLISKLLEANVQEGTNNGNNQTALRELLEDRNELGETPLYRAVALGRTKMAKFLARRIGDIKDHFHRNDKMSILHIAVVGQHFETALWLLGKDKELGKRKGTDDMTCLHLLAKLPYAFKSSTYMNPMKTFIYNRLPAHLHDDDDDDDKGHVEDDSSGSESGMEDLERCQCSKSLRKSKDQHPSAISRVYHAIWKGLAKEWPSIEKMWEMKRTHTSAIKLTQLLVKMDTTWKNSFLVEDKTISLREVDSRDLSATGKEVEVEDSSSDQGEEEEEEGEGEGGTKRRPSGAGRDQYSTLYTPLLIAASQGIVEILDEMLRQHPQAIEHLNSNEENLLHVAIAHRQLQIFHRLKDMEVIMRCRLVSRIDVKGYTILHHVGDLSKRSGEDIEATIPGFQLQEELKWLERVRKVMPSHYTLHRDNAGRTADELFKTKHANLLNKAQEWIKEMTGLGFTVAGLVATVAFAAAYTVPGGTDDKGHPIFLHSPIFSFFTITNAVSLASSLTSIVMFLSISTSPLEQQYFHTYFPRRLTIGFTLLFFSMITATLSFTATVLLIIHSQNRAWTSTLIYAAAFLPVFMFALLQFPFYAAFVNTRHYLFKAMKKVLPNSLMHLRFFRAVKRKTYSDLM